MQQKNLTNSQQQLAQQNTQFMMKYGDICSLASINAFMLDFSVVIIRTERLSGHQQVGGQRAENLAATN